MTLFEFEEKIGKSVSELTVDDVKNLIEDKDFVLSLNTDPTFSVELANKIIDTNSDDSVKAEFIPIKYHYEIYDSQIKLSQMFAQYADDKDVVKLVQNLEEFLKGATPLSKLNAYLVILNSFEDYDLKRYDDDIKATVKEVEDTLINKIDPTIAFPIACETIDALYRVQQAYFERYNIDVIAEDATKLNEYVARISKVAQPLYDSMAEKLDNYVPEDATPEDMGFLDVTKLKEKEGDN